MSVWICIPSIRPGGGTLPTWKQLGYRVAVLRQGEPLPYADLQIPTHHYLGWAPSINRLVRAVMAQDSEAQWMVGGGDDTLPDPDHTPEVIAQECSKHFLDAAWPMCWQWAAGYKTPEEALAAGAYAEQKRQALWSAELANIYRTFGVMQPTGDRFARGSIDNIAGSPWMGREFCHRMYGGAGPMFDGYKHCFGDNELQEVAKKLGVFWQRPDLVHMHEHWTRENDEPNFGRPMPGFLAEINSREHWNTYQALFNARQAAGFPGHEPIA